VRLNALLDFWEALASGSVKAMPHFDPLRSTTNDVVRQAIIPLSRNEGVATGGRALATVWSDGQHVLAAHMVTHAWSNLFLHLIAGIVADALGAEYFMDVAERLLHGKEDIDELRAAIRERGLLEEAYWVCAFSINQHAGICAGFGPAPEDPESLEFHEWDAKRRDSVTQEVFQVCGCGEPKFFNDKPESCEMNKFDSMMRHLCSSVRGFTHVVAVDADFELCTRAWCIAEIVESGECGIPKRIMIHSEEMLDRHYESLSTIDVRDCRASRVEDKLMILQKIRDVDTFNTQLQWAIFGTQGVFSRLIDAQDRAALIARIVVRARSCTSKPSRSRASSVSSNAFRQL